MRLKFTILLCLFSFSISSAQWLVSHQADFIHSKLNVIKFQDDGLGFAMGGLGQIFRSYDFGETWESFTYEIGLSFQDFEFVDSCRILAIGLKAVSSNPDHTHLLESEDCGESWQMLRIFNSTEYVDLDFMDENTGVMVGAGRIVRTTNGGSNWPTVWSLGDNNYNSGNLSGVHFPSSQVGYATGFGRDEDNQYRSILLKSEDQGLSWTEVYNFTGNNFDNSMFFADDTTGFLGTDYGRVWKTDNGGLNWTEVFHLEQTAINAIHFPSKDTGYFVGVLEYIIVHGPELNDFFIGNSVDTGMNWDTLYRRGIPLHDVYFVNDTLGFTCGNLGLILKTTTGGGSLDRHYPWDLVLDEDEVEVSNSIKVYPNPVSDFLHIELTKPLVGVMQARIINLQGQLLQNYQYTQLQDAPVIDVSNLPAGLYFLNLSFGDGQKIMKFIKH